MPVSRRIGENVARLNAALDEAARRGADIMLSPEGSLSGYRPDFNRRHAEAGLAAVTAHARARGVGLALGTCRIEDDGCCYNELRFYHPSGHLLGFHAKTLLCGTPGPRPRGEIRHYARRPLRVFRWAPGLVIGGLICNDVWANPECTPMADPHLTQRLAARGARIVFHAVNGGRDGSANSRLNWQYHEANLRMRARAGRLWLVTVDNAHPVSLPCSAPSGVLSPDGEWVCRTRRRGEELFVHPIELPRVSA